MVKIIAVLDKKKAYDIIKNHFIELKCKEVRESECKDEINKDGSEKETFL